MTKITIKCLLVATVFFFGVLLGIQEAHKGNQEMKGFDHRTSIEKSVDDAKSKTSSKDARKQLVPLEKSNGFSAAGDAASQMITGLFRHSVNATSSIIEDILT